MARQAAHHLKTTIGRNLRAARERKGFTQRKLAQLIDTDAFQISRWEIGKVRPSDTTLFQLAEALEVEYPWLLIEHESDEAAA